MDNNRLVAALLALVVLCTTVPGVAVAQNESADGGDDSVFSSILDTLAGIQSGISDLPQEIYDKLPPIITDTVATGQELLSGILSSAASGFVGLFGDTVELATYVPAPGDPTDPSTWVPVDSSGNAKNTLWGDVYDATQINIALAIIMLAFSGALNFRYSNAVRRRQAWKTWGLSFSMVFLTWFIAPFGLHVASTLSDGLAPGASEFLDVFSGGFTDFAKFGYGLFINAVIVVLFPAIGFIGLLVITVQVFLLLLVIYLWPLGWAAVSFKEGYLHSVGQFVVNLYGGLLVLNVAQGLILRLLLSVDFTQASVQGTLMSLLMIPGGVLFATVLLPYAMLKQITMGAGVDLGMRDLGHKAEYAGRHYRNAERRYEKRKGQVKKTGRDVAATLSAVSSRFRPDDDDPDPEGGGGGGGGAVARLPRGRATGPPAERGTAANPIALPRNNRLPRGRPTGDDSGADRRGGGDDGDETPAQSGRASRPYDEHGNRSPPQRMSRERRRREQIRRDQILDRDGRRR